MKYEGSNENFKQGFPTGFGSALAFKEVRDNGDIVFLGLTDRGPNGDAPQASINGKTLSGKFFPTPKFNPEYYEPLEHCLGSLEQVKSKGWSRTEPAPIF